MRINLSSVSIELFDKTEETIKWREFVPPNNQQYLYIVQRTVQVPSKDTDGNSYYVTVHIYSKEKLASWESCIPNIAQHIVERMKLRV